MKTNKEINKQTNKQTNNNIWNLYVEEEKILYQNENSALIKINADYKFWVSKKFIRETKNKTYSIGILKDREYTLINIFKEENNLTGWELINYWNEWNE